MWNDESDPLKNRISQLSNEELLRMVNIDYEQYRKEALDYARAEMDRRGLKIEPVSFTDAPPVETGDENSEYIEPGAKVLEAEQFDRETGDMSGVGFKVFRGILTSGDQLFAEAAVFATEIGSVRLISISHSASGDEGIVTVWYWA
jgi:hypothetical protein